MWAGTSPVRGAGNCARSDHGPQPGPWPARPRSRQGACPQTPDGLGMRMRAGIVPLPGADGLTMRMRAGTDPAGVGGHRVRGHPGTGCQSEVARLSRDRD